MNNFKQAIKEAENVLDSLGIEYGPIDDIVINSRAKSRWGCCKYNPKTRDFVIEINVVLLSADYTALMNTLIHELLHAHESRIHDGHLGMWKVYAEKVNHYYPEYTIKRCTSAEEKGLTNYRNNSRRNEGYKYIIVCDGCGNVDKYRRKSKVVSDILANPKHSNCWCTLCKSHSFTVKSV